MVDRHASRLVDSEQIRLAQEQLDRSRRHARLGTKHEMHKFIAVVKSGARARCLAVENEAAVFRGSINGCSVREFVRKFVAQDVQHRATNPTALCMACERMLIRQDMPTAGTQLVPRGSLIGHRVDGLARVQYVGTNRNLEPTQSTRRCGKAVL